LRFFFVKTLKRRYSLDDTPYPKAPRRLPHIPSVEKVAPVIDAADTLRLDNGHCDWVSGKESSNPAGHRLWALKMEQVTDAFDLAALKAGNRRAEKIVDFDPERLGVAAEHGQRRLCDGRSLPGVERPFGQTWKLHPEKGV
jgi:hypothetical protein